MERCTWMEEMAAIEAQIQSVEVFWNLYINVPVNTMKEVGPDVTRTGIFQNDERKIVEVLVDFDKVHANVEAHGLEKKKKNVFFVL